MSKINCEFCDLTPEEKKWQLYEDEHWIVFMADKQDYPGRCIVMSRRHIETNRDVTAEEWLSLRKVVGGLEELVKNELGAALINWSCLMNDAYKAAEPHPHLHFHVRPRYSEPVKLFGYEFRDEEFAHHYNNKKPDMDAALKQKLFEYMKARVGKYLG